MKSRRVKTIKSATLIVATLAVGLFQSFYLVNHTMLLLGNDIEGKALIAAFMFPFLASIISVRFIKNDESHGIMFRNTIILSCIIMTYFLFRVLS